MAKIQIKSDKHSIGKELNGPSWRNLTKNKGQTRLVVHCLTFAFNNKFLLLNLSFVFGKKRFYLSSHTPLIIIGTGNAGIARADNGWINHNLVLVMQHRGFVHHRVLYINL